MTFMAHEWSVKTLVFVVFYLYKITHTVYQRGTAIMLVMVSNTGRRGNIFFCIYVFMSVVIYYY